MKIDEQKPTERKLIVFDEELYNRMLQDFSRMLKEEAQSLVKEKEWLSFHEASELLGFRS